MHLIPVPSQALQFCYALTNKSLTLSAFDVSPPSFFFVFPCLFSGLLGLGGRGLLLLLGGSGRLSSWLGLRRGPESLIALAHIH